MNARSFKTVFSKRLGALVAVGEHATSQGKANGASGPGASGANDGAVSALAGIGYVAALSASFAFVSLAWAAPATNALPTGGTVVQGAASMSQNASQLNIQQTTQRAAINWQSFNIGAAATVKVAQPSAQAVLLNRVVGQSPSQIFGKLQANGHVILVNPNGVLFGKDGSVNAGGFTASTLNISDANFMAGNMVYERNGSTAGIVNEGKISTEPGGYVALLGATVSNEGSITTKGGSVVMGAGETIKVPVSGTGRIKLELTPAAINASVSNSKDGSIVTEGGQVYMQALALNRAAAQILQSGSIDTTGEKGGEVHVLADGGHIRVSGSIKANSNNGTAGGDIYIGRDKDTNMLAAVGDASGARLESKGGFVETSGEFLKVDGARVIAKDWLLDPFNITIGGPSTTTGATGLPNYSPGASSNISVADILTSLNAGTSVKISTGLAGSNGNQDGNIDVNASIEKTGTTQATLTLEANNRINIANGVKITDGTTDNLSVHLIANGAGGGSQSFVMGRNSAIDVGGDVTVDVTSLNKNGVNEGSAIFMNAGSRLSTDTTSPYATGRTYIRGKDVNINMTLSGTNRMGMFTQHAVGIEATGSQLNITSTYTDALLSTTNRRIALFMGSGWGPNGCCVAPASAFLRADNGAITVDSKSLAHGTAGGINLAGTQVTAQKDVAFKTSNVRASDIAINIGQEFHAPVVQSSEGNVTIIADQGSVQMGSLAPNAIKGKHVVIANTGGTFDATSGGFTAGSGTYKGSNGASVGLSGWGSSVVASGNMTVVGVGDTSGSAGIVLNGAGLRAGGDLNVTGKHVGPGTTNGIFSTGTFESQNSNVNITGVSEHGSALSLHGNFIKAQNAVNISGTNTGTTNTTQAIYIKRNVTATEGNILITANSAGTTTQALRLDGGSSLNTMSETAQIVIKSDSVSLDGSASTSIKAGATGKGTVEIRNLSQGLKVNLGGDDVNGSASDRTIGLANSELQRISAGNLVIGSETAGDIKVSQSITTKSTTGNLELVSGGQILIEQALTVGDFGDRKNLNLNAGGSEVKQVTNAVVTANQLTIKAAQAAVSLNAATNQVNQLAANVKSIQFKNGKALQIGVGNAGITASGRIKVETTTGNLTIAKSVATTNAGVDAVVLNAGADKTFNNLTGLFDGLADGNIVAGGGAVTVGEGGVAQLYTGRTSENTASLAGGDGTGRYRYNSDESTTNFSKALEAGVNVIYREAPEVTVKVSDVNKVYDGVAHSGGAFSSASTAVGLKNGDTDALVGSNAKFAGDAQDVKDVLASVGKTISASDNGKNALGYKVTYKEGNLSITPRPLTIAPGSVATKTADGNTTAVVTPGALSNLVGTETLGVAATGTFSDANSGNNKAVNAFYTLQNGANGGVVSNYVLNLGTPANPDTRMTGNILASVNPVTPIAPVNNNTGSVSRVRTVSGFGNSGAATGVLDDTPVTESREVCSDVFPENCECQPSVIPSIEICFAPKSVAATKEEK